jgi:hypothetical protein
LARSTHSAPAIAQPLTRRARNQSLALAHLTVSEDDTVLFSPWTETDFRCAVAWCNANPSPCILFVVRTALADCVALLLSSFPSVCSTGLAPWWK